MSDQEKLEKVLCEEYERGYDDGVDEERRRKEKIITLVLEKITGAQKVLFGLTFGMVVIGSLTS